MNPFVATVVAATAAAVLTISPAAPLGQVTEPTRWPVIPATVLTDFEPHTPYGPGHRGIDLAAPPGGPVFAALPGTVTVAGTIAGRPVVVVAHRDVHPSLRTTYLPVRPGVQVGDQVEAGDLLGTVGLPYHSEAVSCLHWGARLGDRYVDPASLLTARIVLLPL
jgi:murein DD-endopeptidase MepM/ murein hydrolase activator NlpD